MNSIIPSRQIFVVVFFIFIGNLAVAQSLRDQHQLEQQKQQAEERRRKEQSERTDSVKKAAIQNGLWITCGVDNQMIIHKGIIWSVRKGDLGFPERYIFSNGVVKWKSSWFNISYELYLDKLELYNSIGQRSDCINDRGDKSAI